MIIFTVNLIIISLIFIPSCFAYIDPGTGGYLISSIFSFILGFFALVLGIVLRFFRHTLKNFILKIWKKQRIFFIFSCIVIVFLFLFSIYFFFFNLQDKYELPSYDVSKNGVQYYDTTKVFDGYNLYEGKLIDMNGKLIKNWNFKYLSILDKNGNYYAQESYESLKWGKFTWDDKPIWIKKLPIHHEIYITPENTIFTFTKEVHEYNRRKVEFDVIVEFSSEGKTLQKWSTWENLNELKKFHKPLELDTTQKISPTHKKNTSIWGGNYDYYHLNSFSLVPHNSMEKVHKAFTPGNWIISFRHGSMIFILDKDSKKVLWSGIYDQIKDNIEGQHSVKMLPDGNLIIFDNGRYREWSRIIKLNPVNMKILWEYKKKDFYSMSQGYIQLLENGNMLITDSEIGRVFELDKNKNIVWEFYNPEFISKIDENKTIRDDIYRMYRYDKKFIDEIIKKKN